MSSCARRAILLCVVFITSISAVGCATPAAPQVVRETVVAPATVPAATNAGTEPVVPAPGSLVVYSGRSESLVGPMIEQFKQTTGIDVQVRYGSTPEIAATLLEEGANSPADVFFAQDPGGLGAVANAGMLETLPGELTARVQEYFRSSDGKWIGVSGRARVVAYNTKALTPEDLPTEIYDFTDAKWKDQVGWAPSNGSFQAMVTAMRVIWGEEKTKAWLEGMIANGAKSYEGNTQIVEAVAKGEVQVGLVNHYYLYRFLAEQGQEFGARNHFLTGGGPGSLVMVAGVGQLATARNPENARKFIEFLVSPVAQQYFANKTFEYPVVDGITMSREIVPLADLNAADIHLTDLADLAGTTKLLRETGALQ